MAAPVTAQLVEAAEGGDPRYGGLLWFRSDQHVASKLHTLPLDMCFHGETAECAAHVMEHSLGRAGLLTELIKSYTAG